MNELTLTEQEFLKHFKKKIRFSRIKIKTKVSIKELCQERKELNFIFGKDEDLVKNILIDFVLYRGGKAIAGIELVDEPDELNLERGKKMLIDTLFKSMGYEYFRVVDLTKLEEASEIIFDKIRK